MKRLKYLLFIMLIVPLFVNAQTYTYNVCKSGCDYNDLNDAFAEVRSKTTNFNNDDVIINITDSESYNIYSYDINYSSENNSNYVNLKSFTFNGNNAKISSSEGTRLRIFSKEVNFNNVNFENYWTDNINDNLQVNNLIGLAIYSDNLNIKNSKIGIIQAVKDYNDFSDAANIKIDQSEIFKIDAVGLVEANDSKFYNFNVNGSNFTLKNIQSNNISINFGGSGNSISNIDFDNLNVSTIAIIMFCQGKIQNSHFGGIYTPISNLSIYNTSGKILNAAESADSIINVYNPVTDSLSYISLNSFENINQVIPNGDFQKLYEPDTWLVNYADINSNNSTAKINIFFDKEKTIKVGENTNFTELFSTLKNNDNIIYEVEDNTVAKVENNKIIGLKTGTTKITATAKDNVATYTLNLNVEKETIPEKIDKMTIKVPITGSKIKAWVVVVSVILLAVIGTCSYMLIRRKK